MKAIVAFLLIIAALEVRCVRVCDIACTPEDEFESGQITPEWDNFMDDLVAKTFTEYTRECNVNKTQQASIDYTSDFLWDLRFRIYSSRQNEEKHTLNECFCDFPVCDSEELRECLAQARIDMRTEISTVWGMEIATELRRLSSLC